MKKVLMFAGGGFVPVREGTHRLVYNVIRHLNRGGDFEVTLAIKGNPPADSDVSYADVCQRIVWMPPPSRNSLWAWVNRGFSFLRTGVLDACGLAHGMRAKFVALARQHDEIIINTVTWVGLLPKELRARAICYTHDLLFYRKASFAGSRTIWQRCVVAIVRALELRVLSQFKKVVVLADYEREEMVRSGFDAAKIIVSGLPMEYDASANCQVHVKYEYDFMMIGAKDQVNIDGLLLFFQRVAPLLGDMKRKLALVGSVCKNPIWMKPGVVPNNIELCLLGFVDDLEGVCRKTKIGISTVPRGSGIKVKSVEMIFRDLPIVTTDHGIEGIPVTDEGVINIDHLNDEGIRVRLATWLTDDSYRMQVGQTLGAKVRQAFSPKVALAELVKELRK